MLQAARVKEYTSAGGGGVGGREGGWGGRGGNPLPWQNYVVLQTLRFDLVGWISRTCHVLLFLRKTDRRFPMGTIPNWDREVYERETKEEDGCTLLACLGSSST